MAPKFRCKCITAQRRIRLCVASCHGASPAKSKVYISVNAHTIRANAKHGRNDPPIRIARTRSDRNPRYANEVELIGKAKIVYSPAGVIMRCGARMVIVADDVKIVR